MKNSFEHKYSLKNRKGRAATMEDMEIRLIRSCSTHAHMNEETFSFA